MSNSVLWICGGIGAAALICCLVLGIAVHSQGQLIDKLQLEVQAIVTAREADAEAQIANDAAKKKADNDAQKKREIVDGVQTSLPDPDFVHGMQRGLRGESADGNTAPPAKSSGTVPGADDAAGTAADR